MIRLEKAVLFYLMIVGDSFLTRSLAAEVENEAQYESIPGYEHYDILKQNVDVHPIEIKSMSDYEEKVIEREKQEVRSGCKRCNPWFIQFQANGCSKCQRVASVWTELHTQYFKDYNIATVNCDGDEAFDLCELFNVKTYPTFVYLAGKEIYYYRGQKDLDSFVKFMSTDYWKSGKEDVMDVPIRKIVIKEEDMTTWQLLWKKLYDFDAYIDDLLEDSDFDVIPKPIRYTFMLFFVSTSSAGVIFALFFDDHQDIKQLAARKKHQDTMNIRAKAKAGGAKEKKD